MKRDEFLIKLSRILIISGILIILLWIIGKLFGLIQSPVWINMIPFIGAAGALCGLGISIGKLLQKIDTIIKDIDKINKILDSIDERINDINQRLIKVETKLS